MSSLRKEMTSLTRAAAFPESGGLFRVVTPTLFFSRRIGLNGYTVLSRLMLEPA